MLTFPRRVKTPISVDGHELEPGTVIMGSIYLTHQREDIYPNPKQFNPERFLEKQFSLFAAGAGCCIGLALAQFEMELALAKILQGWEMELVDTLEVKPKRSGLVTGPNKPIKMICLGPRQQQS
jgi:cytochrome P450